MHGREGAGRLLGGLPIHRLPTSRATRYCCSLVIKQTLVGIALLLGLVLDAEARSKVTVDVTSFTAPSGWKHTDQKHSVEYTTATPTGAGSLLIMRSFACATDAHSNFDKAWKTFVTDALPGAPAPTVTPTVRRDGWQLVRGTGAFEYEGNAGKISVLAAIREASCVVVVATTIGKAFEKEVDQVLASLRFAAPAPSTPAKATTPAHATQTLSGAWGFATGGAMGSGQYAPWLSDRREYTFDNGSYTFLRRHNVDREPETSIIRERGTYTFHGDVLALTPTKAEREIWSKVRSGANAGAYDRLLRREKVPMEKAEYRVSYTRYLETQVPNLMLTPRAATQRDGNFNATTQYRYFRPDGNYYTAVPPTP